VKGGGGREGNGSMHLLGFSEVGAYVLVTVSAVGADAATTTNTTSTTTTCTNYENLYSLV